MDNINEIIGQNLLTLRKNKKITQLELAEKFNYSDKSISKWEKGESLPSIEVLNELAKFYNVTLDALVSTNDILSSLANKKEPKPKVYSTKLVVTLLAVSAVWLCATILYVCLLLTAKINYTLCFFWAIPLTCIVLVVFNSIWGHFPYLFPILSILLWSSLSCTHFQVLAFNVNIWPIYFLGIPIEIAIILWAALVRRPKGYYKKIKEEKKNNNTEIPESQIEDEEKIS